MRRKEREVTEPAEIEKIISEADVCRVAFANGDMPYIVTMNFGYRPGQPEPVLYFHCAMEGRKLEMMRKNNYVCFEMDTGHLVTKGEKGCDWGMNYKSVVGYGYLSEVMGEDDRREGLNCIMDHYGGERHHDYDRTVLGRTKILCLRISEISAKVKS